MQGRPRLGDSDRALAKARLLARIQEQRDRLKARHQAADGRQASGVDPARTDGCESSSPGSTLLKAVAYARQHPAVVLGLLGVCMAAGPRRIVRWVSFALPLLSALRKL